MGCSGAQPTVAVETLFNAEESDYYRERFLSSFHVGEMLFHIKFSKHFLSGRPFLRRSKKWAWKSLCVGITNSPEFKKVLTSAWGTPVQTMILTNCIGKTNGKILSRWAAITTSMCSVAPCRWFQILWVISVTSFITKLICYIIKEWFCLY